MILPWIASEPDHALIALAGLFGVVAVGLLLWALLDLWRIKQTNRARNRG